MNEMSNMAVLPPAPPGALPPGGAGTPATAAAAADSPMGQKRGPRAREGAIANAPFPSMLGALMEGAGPDTGGVKPDDPAIATASIGQIPAGDGKPLPPVAMGLPGLVSADGGQDPLPVMTASLNPASADDNRDLPPLAAVKSDIQNTADGADAAGDPATTALAASMGPALPPALQTALPPQNDAAVGDETEIAAATPAAKPATLLRPVALSLPATNADTDAGAQYLPQPGEVGKQTAEPQQPPALTAGLVKESEQRLSPPSREAMSAIATVADAARQFPAVSTETSRAPGTAPAIPVPVNHPQWEQALGERVLWCVNRHSSTAQLSLNPPDLGPLEIRISLDRDRAHVLFVSPHETVREAISAAVPRLQDMLGEAGIQLLDVGIERHASGRQPQAFLPPAPHGTGASEESAADVTGLGTRMAVGLVDYYI